MTYRILRICFILVARIADLTEYMTPPTKLTLVLLP